MAKEFAVPPVVFTSGTTDDNHCIPMPSSEPPPFRPPNNSLPFMSFDIGTAATTSSSVYSAPVFASNNAFFDDEAPLIEELGINTRQIWRKTRSILNPIKLNPDLHEDADLSGPFLFLLAFGLFQLLAGKLHFGIILGWVVASALFLYVVFNMMAGRSGALDLYRCVSLVGYCMLPVVMFSALSLVVPRSGPVAFGMGLVFVVWSTRVCSGLSVELGCCGEENKGLVAYACFLIYTLFSLLVLF